MNLKHPKNLKEFKISKSNDEWKKVLSPLQYKVTREKATERAFTGEYLDLHKNGIFTCVCCGADLFSSQEKFDSGSGWPSYWKPIQDDHIAIQEDNEFFMKRTEVLCSQCGAHLGHVFPDGPEPTGLRYCINSISLDFKEKV